jgi:hypothetical protein
MFKRSLSNRTPEERNGMKCSERYRLILLVGAVLIFPGHMYAQAKIQADGADPGGKRNVVVEGLMRDVACPLQNSKSTATNFNLECAVACAKSGSPLIILTKKGNSYFPISDQMPDPDQRPKLMPFVGKFVRVTGTVFERNGTRVIAIQTIKELTDVNLKANHTD